MAHSLAAACLLCLALSSTACTGGVDRSPATSGPNQHETPGAAGTGGQPPTASVATAAPASGRRLTRVEYLNTLQDLLGVDPAPLRAIVLDDGGSSGFRNAFSALLPAATRTDAYEQAAIHVASSLPSELLLKFASCREPSEPCTSGFVSGLGRLLYRRPLTVVETSRLAQLFAVAVGEGDGFEAGARLVLQAMLQSPAFLYRLERTDRLEPGTGLSRVDGFEMASRLSFLLWQSAPDVGLLDAAATGALESPEAIVQSMLEDRRARRGLGTFFDEWLSLYKLESTQRDAALYPGFSPDLAREMRKETQTFLEKLVFDERAPFSTAYTAQTTSFDAGLAALYGVAAPSGPHDFSSDVTRGGLLTQAGVLTAHTVVDSTSIVDRGLFVLRTLLCSNVPPPPANAAQSFAKVDESLPQRARFEQHRVDPACGGCHAVFDPLGYPFEAYDAIGRFQTVDRHGNPIQVSGSARLDGVEHSYANLEEFSAILAKSPSAEACLVQQLTRYAFGRALDSGDDPLVAQLAGTFRDSQLDFLKLAQALALSPAYRYVPRDEPTALNPEEAP